jgi:hypothetical protein
MTSRPARLCALLAVATTVAAAVPATGSADGSAQVEAARTCSIRGQERSLGPSYVTSLKVSGVSCATGKAVVRAYHKCRFRNGGARGRCTKRVMGYRCKETRSGIQVQFNAKVSCRNGGRRVDHTYTQNT